MSERNKGLYHLLLAIAAGTEILSSPKRTRMFLLGAMAGWHLVLAAEHFTDTTKEK